MSVASTESLPEEDISKPFMQQDPVKQPLCLPSIFGYHRITVEPALVLIALSRSLSGAVLTQLLLVRTCEVTLGINTTICDQLVTRTNHTEAEILEDQVQPHTAILQMAKTLVEACIPAFLSLFLGPWSDRYGRKLLMVWPLMGHSAMFWVITIMSLVPSLPPKYFLLSSLPVALSGGFLSIIASAFSFMSDITLPERRSFR
ncbi:hypothetical protein ANN_04708 [Periplaneta americana]|uniref:Uncharacterized protein n=1 Tax=Periplaneta americana TaxID=6978 RepID=A0ABQ8TAU5_PERAM|nr:hypothetical protein ANN_04708 [Periplaneta americana]